MAEPRGSGIGRLLRSEPDWTIREVWGLLGMLYHTQERRGVPDEQNLFQGITATRSPHYRELKKRVLPAANQYEPFTRMMFLAQAFRRQNGWSSEWRQLVPLFVIAEMIGTDLVNIAGEALDQILDDDSLSAVEAADALSALLLQLPSNSPSSEI